MCEAARKLLVSSFFEEKAKKILDTISIYGAKPPCNRCDIALQAFAVAVQTVYGKTLSYNKGIKGESSIVTYKKDVKVKDIVKIVKSSDFDAHITSYYKAKADTEKGVKKLSVISKAMGEDKMYLKFKTTYDEAVSKIVNG